MKLRYKLYFSFSIPTPGFPHFYYMLGANLGLLLYGEVSVMASYILYIYITKSTFYTNKSGLFFWYNKIDFVESK